MKPLLALSLLAMVAVAFVPPVAGDASPGAVNLGGFVEAGAFRAARIQLLAPQALEIGGVFSQPVTTDHPVLPIFAALRAVGSGLLKWKS